MEINAAVAQSVKQQKHLQKENITQTTEPYTKVDVFFKQMKAWEVNVCALAEHCVEWDDAVPRLVLKDIGKKYSAGQIASESVMPCSDKFEPP